MPNLAQLTDAYYTDPVPAELPVEQPYLGVPADPDGLRRVYINTPSREALPGEVATTGRPEPRPEPGIEENPLEVWAKKKAEGASLWDNFGMAGVEDKSGKSENKLLKKLFGLGGEERYQLWPEKVLREGLAGAGEVMDKGTNLGLRREDVTDIPPPQMPTIDSTRLGKLLGIAPVAASPQDDIIEKAQAISALAGSGGLAGTTDATLGSAPFLRPALKYKDRLYKGKEGQQHMDVIPENLYPEFQKMAMSGEDISHYNFGFVNDKGQFLTREKALQYAVDTGLVDKHAGQYGALTSTLMADSSKPGTAIEAMAQTAKPFYSAVEHNLSAIPQSKMTGDQWLGTLANKPGVKGEELDWTGLKGFLEENKGKPVTKAQIEEHLAANKIELKEVSKGKSAEERKSELENLGDKRTLQQENELNDILDGNWNGEHGTNATKYHSYQLPGGSNYREMLLTLPEKKRQFSKDQIENAAKDIHYAFRKNRNEKWENLSDAEKQKYYNDAEKAKVSLSKEADPNSNYKSSHWDEPNILAHVRMNDRIMKAPDELKALNENAKKALETANDNKTSNIPMSFLIDALEKQGLKNGRDFIISKGSDKKSLHLEEIQSDWHQQGRDKGYAKPLSNEEVAKQLYENFGRTGGGQTWEQLAPTTRNEYLERAKAQGKLNSPGVPDAPFKKTWHELALKRMLREAAEKGYDRLSWTPGEAQAARYDLSKDVSKVYLNNPVWHGENDIRGNLIVTGKNGNDLISKPVKSISEIKDLIGKEAADNLVNKPSSMQGRDHVLSGDGLKVGGEGMKGFYDQIIPKALEKLGKEHGVKVKTMEIDSTRRDAMGRKSGEIKKDKIHYIDIPQSLKDAALQKGFPLFSNGYMLVPVQGNPFENKQ